MWKLNAKQQLLRSCYSYPLQGNACGQEALCLHAEGYYKSKKNDKKKPSNNAKYVLPRDSLESALTHMGKLFI